MKIFRSRICTFLVTMAGALGALSCGDSEGQDSKLLEVQRRESAETERLKKLQTLRAWVPDGNRWDVWANPFDFFNGLPIFKESALPATACGAGTWMRFAEVQMAQARTFKQIADSESVFRFNNKGLGAVALNQEFPPQEPAARVALYIAARRYLRNALWYALTQLGRGPLGYTTEGGFNWITELLNSCPDGQFIAEYVPKLIREIANLYEEVSRSAAEVSVQAGDAIAASAASKAEGATWRFSSALYSRSSAAHLLLGGIDLGWGNSTEATPFCSSARLKPGGKLALEYLRQAGQSPRDILSTTRTTTDLLNNCSDDCARARLAEILFRPELALPGVKLEEVVDLKMSDFEEARAYLRLEIKGLRRSMTQTLPLQVEGQTQPQYAGVTSKPSSLPSVVWAALGRGATSATGTSSYIDQFVGQNAEPLDFIVDPSPGELYSQLAVHMINTVQEFSSSNQYLEFEGHRAGLWTDTIQNFTNQIVQARQRNDGQFSVFGTNPDPGAVTINTYRDMPAIGSDDGLFLVDGEDGLRCALEGQIEGVACNLPEHLLSPVMETQQTTGGYAYSWRHTWQVVLPNIEANQRRTLYAIDGSSGINKALVGAEVVLNAAGAMTGSVNAGIRPELDAKAATYVALDAGWCGQTQFDCRGFRTDERIPLENSLASDADPMESSWKYYLDLAKTAAEETRTRGEEYFQAGLQYELRKESNWSQAHEAEIRAAAAIDEVQDICGTALDPRKLMKFLEADGDDVTGEQLCGDSAKCIERLVTKANEYPEDPDMSRLVECLDPKTIRPFVSAGSTSLCVWIDSANENKICDGATAEFPCPVAAGVDESCAGMAIPPDQIAKPWPITGGDLLGYFSGGTPAGTGIGPQAQQICKLVRDLRYGTEVSGGTGVEPVGPKGETFDRGKWWQWIVDSRFFDVTNLQTMATQGIGLTLRPRNNFDLTFNGETVWSTGDIDVAGASNGLWPCTDAGKPEDCAAGSPGLFCESFNCDTLEGRANLINRIRGAVDFAVAGKIAPGKYDFTTRFPPGVADVPFGSLESEDPMKVDGNSYFWTCGSGSLGDCQDYVGEVTIGLVGRSAATVPEVGLAWTRCDYSNVDDDSTSWGKSRADTRGSAYTRWSTTSSNALWYWTGSERPSSTGGQNKVVFSNANVIGRNRWFGEFRHKPTYFYAALRDRSTVLGPTTADGNYFLNTGYPDYDGAAIANADPAIQAELSWSYNLAEKLLVPRQEKVYQAPPCRWNDPGAICELSTAGVLDALELSCQVMARKGGACSFTSPPPLGNTADLSVAKGYLDCLANTLESAGGNTLFARVPERVRDVIVGEGGLGAFPAVGGQYGAAVSRLRAAMVELSDVTSAIGFEVRQMASSIEQLNTAKKLLAAQNKEVDIQQEIATIDSIMSVAASTGSVISSFGTNAGAIASIASSLAKLDLSNQLADLKKQENALTMDLKLQELGDQMSQRARTLQTYSTRITDSSELITAQLQELENLRLRAGRKAVEAITVAEYRAPNSDGIDNSYAWAYEEAKRRYDTSNDSAVRLAVLARKAIEQRLGVNLEEMTQELPLVDAPSSWVNQICSVKGIDFAGILESQAADETSDKSESIENSESAFMGHYVGEYVSKLEKTVESYRQEFPFADGVDEAVVSVRDDLQKVSENCSVESPNLLPNSSGLATGSALTTPGAGWVVKGCPNPQSYDVTSTDTTPYACLLVGSHRESIKVDGQALPTYDLDFSFESCSELGCVRGTTNPSLSTSVWLGRGNYYVSLYQPKSDCRLALNISSPAGEAVWTNNFVRFATWKENDDLIRRGWGFTVDTPGQFDFAFELANPGHCPAVSSKLTVAGMMIQAVPYSAYEQLEGLIPYADSDANGMWSIPTCKDSNGNAFQRQGWARKCMRLCRSGYGTTCQNQTGQEECFHELRFRLDDLLLEKGMALQAAGFAKGNYNYRVDQVGVNFVGTGIRNCDSSASEAACAGNATVQYSLEHNGPFYTRNHQGEDVQTLVYDGKIEHARGLAAERYVTNPLSSTDRSLIEPYVRSELQGWPLSGEYVLRVWESSDVKFENIDDVQFYLKYRYWTRLK